MLRWLSSAFKSGRGRSAQFISVLGYSSIIMAASGATATLSDHDFFFRQRPFDEACRAAVSQKARLLIGQAWKVSTASCAADISFTGTGSITYSGAVTLSGNVESTSGLRLIREGSGTLTFAGTSRTFRFSWWGTAPDGTDQTERFQAALESVNSSGGGTLIISAAPDCYTVRALKYYSNTTIMGESRSACIRKLGGAQQAITPPGGGAVFYNDAATPVSNVHFRNFTIDGNRLKLTGIHGDGGDYGIILFGASNSSIEYMTITDAYTDGITIDGAGPSRSLLGSGITISHTVVTRSRRNNVSLLAGRNTTISDCELSYAKGTSPEAGFDVEQYQDGAYVTGLKIVDTEVHHNAKDGVLLNVTHQNDPDLAITVANVNSHDNGGIGLNAMNFTRVGKLSVVGGEFTGNRGCCAINVAGWTQVTLSGESTSGSSRGLLVGRGNQAVTLGPGSISGTLYDLSVDGPDSRVTLDGATLIHGIVQPGEEKRVRVARPQ